MLKKIFPWLLIGISTVSIVNSQNNYQKHGLQSKVDNSPDASSSTAQENALQALRFLPKLGFENIWSNWLYLQFIQYYGDTDVRDKYGYELIPVYFKQIVDNDPRFLDAYFVLSTANSIFAGRPDLTISLADKVLNNIYPKFNLLTPFVWSYKGVDQLLFFGDIQGAKQSYSKAAQWAIEQNNQNSEAIAQRNLEIVNFLDTNPDSQSVKLAGWTLILNEARDKEVQQRALKEIKKLGASIKQDSEGNIQIIPPSTEKTNQSD